MKQFIQRIFKRTDHPLPVKSEWTEIHEQDLANFAAALRAQRAENGGHKRAAMRPKVA